MEAILDLRVGEDFLGGRHRELVTPGDRPVFTLELDQSQRRVLRRRCVLVDEDELALTLVRCSQCFPRRAQALEVFNLLRYTHRVSIRARSLACKGRWLVRRRLECFKTLTDA